MNPKILDQIVVTQSQRWAWFPTVGRFSTGEVLAAVWMAPDENEPESMVSGYCISKDNGRTWGPRHPKGDGGHCHFSFDDGTMLELGYHTTVEAPGPATEFRTTRILYREGGQAFEQRYGRLTLPQPPKLVPPSPMGGINTGSRTHVGFVFDHSVVRGRDGSLLATIYGKFQDDPLYCSAVVRSTDQGLNWGYLSTIAGRRPLPISGLGQEGPCEPSMVRLRSGDLFSIMRTGSDGYMVQCWSKDDGKTWTPARSSGLKGVQPDLCLLSNGVLAVSFGRPGPVSVAFSEDGTGERWSHVTPLFEGRSTRYTGMVEVEPNVLLIVYDSVPEGWKPIADPSGPINSVRCALVSGER
jgi:hypothetical protein